MPVFRLAWTEFSLPFRHLRSGVPGGRGFLWLTSLLMLVLTLGLLLQATRVGLLERFIDVFLGTVEGHGADSFRATKGRSFLICPNPQTDPSLYCISAVRPSSPALREGEGDNHTAGGRARHGESRPGPGAEHFTDDSPVTTPQVPGRGAGSVRRSFPK